MSSRFKKVALKDLVFDAKYQALPDWPDDLMDETVQQIKEEGDVRVPVVIDEENRVLDGHQRVKAAGAAKVASITCDRVVGLSETDKLRYVFGQLGRRHLTQAEKRQAAEDAVLRMHEYSNSKIARTIGIYSDKSIRKIRMKLVAARTIPDHETLIGIAGTSQKAVKCGKSNTDPKAEPKAEPKPGDGKVGTGEKGEEDKGEEAKPESKPKPGDGRADEGLRADGKAEEAGKADAGKDAAEGQPEPKGEEANDPKPEPKPEPKAADPKPRGQKQPENTIRVSLAARMEPGRLVLEGNDLDRLPSGLKEILLLIVCDAAATHVKVSLDPKLPTLVIHHPV